MHFFANFARTLPFRRQLQSMNSLESEKLKRKAWDRARMERIRGNPELLEALRAYRREYLRRRMRENEEARRKNRERALESYRRRRDEINARRRAEYGPRPPRLPVIKRKRRSRRRPSPVELRLIKRCRRRFEKVVKGKRSPGNTRAFIGTSLEGLQGWLELQWKPGMNWEEYGKAWHIDHKRPIASFDLTIEAEVKACFHFTNLQPLWADENIRKGARWTTNFGNN